MKCPHCGGRLDLGPVTEAGLAWLNEAPLDEIEAAILAVGGRQSVATRACGGLLRSRPVRNWHELAKTKNLGRMSLDLLARATRWHPTGAR